MKEPWHQEYSKEADRAMKLEIERDELRSEASSYLQELAHKDIAVKELNAEVARLKADKARLDWMNDAWEKCAFISEGEFVSGKLRDAIDAAMEP